MQTCCNVWLKKTSWYISYWAHWRTNMGYYWSIWYTLFNSLARSFIIVLGEVGRQDIYKATFARSSYIKPFGSKLLFSSSHMKPNPQALTAFLCESKPISSWPNRALTYLWLGWTPKLTNQRPTFPFYRVRKTRAKLHALSHEIA